MLMRIKKFFILLLLCCFSYGFSVDFNEAENDFIQKVLMFRLSLRSYQTPDEAIQAVIDFRQSNETQILTLGEEAKLSVENMLTTAHYNFVYEKDMYSPEMEKILRPQFEKISAYTNENEKNGLNPWYILSSADIINSMLQFLPRSNSIKYGLKEKKDFAMVLENYPDMAFAYMLSAYWHYYAPAIGGGSKNTAKEYFLLSLEKATNDYELYYGNINVSQICFEEKNKTQCQKYLDEAEKVLPNTRYIAFIRKINELGYSLFDYNMNSTREKLNEKLKL